MTWPWYAYVVIGCFVIQMLAMVAMIGEPRRPITPMIAVVNLVANGLIVWAIVALAEGAS